MDLYVSEINSQSLIDWLKTKLSQTLAFYKRVFAQHMLQVSLKHPIQQVKTLKFTRIFMKNESNFAELVQFNSLNVNATCTYKLHFLSG